MNCIYTVFYNNLKSYDGNDINKQLRLEMFDMCINSFRKFNPQIPIMVDRVEEEISNTADMYFDKMNRIKELNYNYNVLWVDADTLCLENISDLFTDTMSGSFWGHWDNMNVVNGGVIYYPKRFLYNNYDKFTSSWINLLSKLNDLGEKFTGPHEQIPITDLLLSQVNSSSSNYDIRNNEKELLKKGLLVDKAYNTNPFTRHYENRNVFNDCNTICGKKILHLNASNNDSRVVDFCRYISENLLGYTHNNTVLLERAEELKISNRFVTIKKSKNCMKIVNNTFSFVTLYEFDNYNRFINNSIFYDLSPGHFYNNCNLKNVTEYVLKNIFSGEIQIIKNK